MKTLRRSCAILAGVLLLLTAIPSGRAFEPASLISAAPQAAALAAMWSPHAISALGSAGQGMVKMGESVVNIFRLPLGVLQSTLGAPFGYFGAGVANCGKGLLAPVQLVWHTLLLPVRLISLGAVK